jgi:hypothetical protein
MTLRLNGSTSGYVEIDAPATAGSNTLTLPNGNGSSGQYLQTNGSGALSWAGVTTGKILQVVQSVKTSEQSNSSASYVQITDLNCSITPSSTNSKILIMVLVSSNIYSGYNSSFFRLTKGGTAISGALGNDSGDSNAEVSFADTATTTTNAKAMNTVGTTYLDSPSSTSALTYGVQWAVPNTNSTYTNYINGPYARDGNSYRARAISTITLMEVAV